MLQNGSPVKKTEQPGGFAESPLRLRQILKSEVCHSTKHFSHLNSRSSSPRLSFVRAQPYPFYCFFALRIVGFFGDAQYSGKFLRTVVLAVWLEPFVQRVGDRFCADGGRLPVSDSFCESMGREITIRRLPRSVWDFKSDGPVEPVGGGVVVKRLGVVEHGAIKWPAGRRCDVFYRGDLRGDRRRRAHFDHGALRLDGQSI